jgi:hypothetical protein
MKSLNHGIHIKRIGMIEVVIGRIVTVFQTLIERVHRNDDHPTNPQLIQDLRERKKGRKGQGNLHVYGSREGRIKRSLEKKEKIEYPRRRRTDRQTSDEVAKDI